MGEVFASAPFIVGKSEPSPTDSHIPAEEALCPVVANDWVNDDYKHLVLVASAKAVAVKPGQFFNLLCPSPDAGELWLRRPQSVYRIDRANGRIEFLYKCVGRGTHGLATVKPGDMLNIVGPLGVGFHLEPAWKNIVVLGRGVGLATLAPISQLAGDNGVGVTAILSARSRALVMADDLFGQGRRRRAGARQRPLERRRQCRENPARADRGKARRRLLHLRLQPADAAHEAARQGARHSRARWRWSR